MIQVIRIHIDVAIGLDSGPVAIGIGRHDVNILSNRVHVAYKTTVPDVDYVLAVVAIVPTASSHKKKQGKQYSLHPLSSYQHLTIGIKYRVVSFGNQGNVPYYEVWLRRHS